MDRFINVRIMGHPINWLIVVAVAALGGIFLLHMVEGGKQVSGAVRKKHAQQNMSADNSADM